MIKPPDPLPPGDGPIPKVSVLVVTMNHERYVAQCLESILAQRTSFPVEILVGVDTSTDRTLEVCREIAGRHPGKVRVVPNLNPESPFIHGVRVGKVNLCNLLPFIRAPFWAICDGDDYWTDPDKLERQVAYLEANPGCALCFHNVWVESGPERRPFRESYGKRRHEAVDLLRGDWLIPSSSVVGRGVLDALPGWYHHTLNGDLALHLCQSRHGTLDLVDGTMAVYRVHPGGVSRRIGKMKGLLSVAWVLNHFNLDTGGRFQDEVEQALETYLGRTVAREMHRDAWAEGRRSVRGARAAADVLAWRDLVGALLLKARRLLPGGGRRPAPPAERANDG